MRSLALVAVAALLGPAAAVLAACGDRSNLIPRTDAEAIEAELDQASADYAAEECRASQRALRRARQRVQDLPSGVDEGLRTNLEEGLTHTLGRVVADCGRQTNTTPTETTATQPTETQSTTIETTPTITATGPEEPPDPPQTTPPEQPVAPPNSGGTPPVPEDPK